MSLRVGILTGGGDCPGLNPVIRAVVRTILNEKGVVLGIQEGWAGAIKADFKVLTVEETHGIISLGGTILGSSRTNPYEQGNQKLDELLASFEEMKLDALIAVGGDDTLGVADKLSRGVDIPRILPCIGVPKTIDNDLSSTDVTFGFYTSIDIVTEAIDRLKTTAESHRRVIVVETMGRHAGWIAWFSGIATDADYTLVPEVPVDLDRMCHILTKRRENGKKYGIIVVSEGVTMPGEDLNSQNRSVDAFGNVTLGGIGSQVALYIKQKTGIDTRCVTLGHLQRGGTPNAYDRVLGTRLGVHAARLVLKQDFGKMVALRGTEIQAIPLQDAVCEMKKLTETFISEAEEFYRVLDQP